jgi:hypothetical protein
MAQAAQKKPREIEADWDQKATQSAIDAARAVVSGEGINARASIGSLSDIEWGWISAAAIFGWIKTKSQQAVAEGVSAEIPIRTMKHRSPEPWEAGAIETILPALGGIEGLDWSKPVGEWSKDQIVSFSWQIFRLASSALAARDEGAADKIVQRLSQPQMERENSAAHGGPLMSRKELNDKIPFAPEFR